MLRDMFGLSNIQVKLAEVAGTRYLFQSGSNYYFWNSVVEEGSRITSPTNYNDLLKQIGSDIRKVQVTPVDTSS